MENALDAVVHSLAPITQRYTTTCGARRGTVRRLHVPGSDAGHLVVREAHLNLQRVQDTALEWPGDESFRLFVQTAVRSQTQEQRKEWPCGGERRTTGGGNGGAVDAKGSARHTVVLMSSGVRWLRNGSVSRDGAQRWGGGDQQQERRNQLDDAGTDPPPRINGANP